MLDVYDLTKLVSMRNDVLVSRYYTQPELELTVTQKKLLMLLISRINSDDKNFKNEEIAITDYCKLFGINYDGSNRKAIRDSILEIGKKCFVLPVDEDSEELFRWVDKLKINYTKGIISIRLAESLRPYYLELHKNFTAFQLGYTIKFKSKYSIALYELCKSKANMKKFYISVEDAYKQFALNKYSKFKDFRRNVIDVALREINQYSDIKVTYKELREGKKITTLMFYISNKTGAALAEVDKWKADVSKNKKIKSKMEKAFIYQKAEDEDSEDYIDIANEQYERLMNKYREERQQSPLENGQFEK